MSWCTANGASTNQVPSSVSCCLSFPMSHCRPSWICTARMPSCTLATATMFYVRSRSLACGPWLTRPVGIQRSSVSWKRSGVKVSRGPGVPPLSLLQQQHGSRPAVHPHRHPVAARRVKVSRGRWGLLQQSRIMCGSLAIGGAMSVAFGAMPRAPSAASGIAGGHMSVKPGTGHVRRARTILVLLGSSAMHIRAGRRGLVFA